MEDEFNGVKGVKGGFYARTQWRDDANTTDALTLDGWL
jgi:hypothetical protein